MGGEAVYREIRKQDTGLPVIFSSGYDTTREDLRIEEDSQARLFIKPYRYSELVQAVEESIGRK